MPTTYGFDGTGRFTRAYSWQAEEAAGTGIVSNHHDEEDNNFAAGFNITFCRDGQAAATGNWNMANHKIGNVGAGSADGDAVNMAQLTGSGATPTPPFAKSLTIAGAGVNGRLKFSSLTGDNGIAWAGADLSWLAKLKVTDETRDRLVLNNNYAGTGGDVAIIDDLGNAAFTSLTGNFSRSANDNQWRTINPGWGFRMDVLSSGMQLFGTDAVTTVDQYVAVTPQLRMEISTYGGSPIFNLRKKSGAFFNAIRGYTGSASTGLRWQMLLGDSAAESADAGSNFTLTPFDDSGVSVGNAMVAYRKTGMVSFPQGITGVINLDNHLAWSAAGVLDAATTLTLGATNNTIFLRPKGYSDTTLQASYNNLGDWQIGRYVSAKGYAECGGTSGTPSLSQVFNSLYVAANDIRCYVGTSLVGYWTPSCDYRIKREIRPLPSTWDAVKKLRPIIFKDAAYGDEDSVFKDGEDDRVGFLAHELQDALGKHAATGEKDGEQIQGPDVMAVVAALTAALQEAQLRIEALEARLAA